MDVIERILARILDGVTFIGALAVFLMMAHITLDVAMRFLLNDPPPGTLVIVSRYYMVVVAFLSLAFAERRSGHINVEIVSERFPLPVQNTFNVLGAMLSCTIFAMLAWRGFEEGMKKQHIGAFALEQDISIPIWPSYYLLPIGAGLMCLTLIFKIVRHLFGGPEKTVLEPF
jgi:TRAP-type C4-dicarboxylate transport system permease small subunit